MVRHLWVSFSNVAKIKINNVRPVLRELMKMKNVLPVLQGLMHISVTTMCTVVTVVVIKVYDKIDDAFKLLGVPAVIVGMLLSKYSMAASKGIALVKTLLGKSWMTIGAGTGIGVTFAKDQFKNDLKKSAKPAPMYGLVHGQYTFPGSRFLALNKPSLKSLTDGTAKGV